MNINGTPSNLRPTPRQKGGPNLVTRSIKAAVVRAFEAIGGVDALAEWARANPGEFYTKLWIKLLPLKMVGDSENPVTFEVVIRPHGPAHPGLPKIERGRGGEDIGDGPEEPARWR